MIHTSINAEVNPFCVCSQVVLESAKKEDGKRLLLATQPSASAFKINEDDVLTFSSDDKQWKPVAKARSAANLNYDLACYHLCFEDYPEAAKCLAAIRGTTNSVLENCDINVDALGGMFREKSISCSNLFLSVKAEPSYNLSLVKDLQTSNCCPASYAHSGRFGARIVRQGVQKPRGTPPRRPSRPSPHRPKGTASRSSRS